MPRFIVAKIVRPALAATCLLLGGCYYTPYPGYYPAYATAYPAYAPAYGPAYVAPPVAVVIGGGGYGRRYWR